MSTVVTLGPVGLKPTGAYNNTREYKKLDVVIYQGSSYVAKSDSIGQLPTNTTYWELLVQKGDTGNGITSIAKTGTSGLVDTYTITYTDETTSTFTVTNGEKGDPGEVTEEQLDEAMARANMVYNALPKVSDEGDSLTLDGTANCPMKMELKGNTEQTTYTGKNLFDGVFRQGGRYTTSLSDTNRLFTTQNCPIKSGVSYTISTTLNTSNFKYAINLATVEYPIENTTEGNAKQYYDSAWKTSSSFTFTPSQDGFLGIVVAKQNGSDDLSPSDIASVNWQLEKGSTATSYEPYVGGTPSPNPDYPQDVKVVTGDNTIKVEGKNLLPNSESLSNTGQYQDAIRFTDLEASTQYTLKIKGTAGDKFYTGGSISYSSLTIPSNGVLEFTFTTNSTISDLAIIKNTTSTNTLPLTECTLCKGSTATYEPYVTPQEYSLNLGSIELCKIRSYQDYIYKENNKWYKHSEIGKVVLDGSETYSSYSNNRFRIPITNKAGDGFTYIISICNILTATTQINTASTTQNNLIAVNGDYIWLRITNSTTEQELKTLLQNTNAILYYILETPTNEEITDTTLISQLNAIENAVSYDTQTNIVQENYSEPFIINAECVRSLKDIFELIQ